VRHSYTAPLRGWSSLALLAIQRPAELRDRAAGYADLCLDRLVERAPAYETTRFEDALKDLGTHLGDVAQVLREPALEEVERETRRLLAQIRAEDPFSPRWAADSLLARCCYLACRLLEPEVVVETGVAYGVSSAFILRALEENGRGTLHSVDLPPLRRDYQRFWGIAVPGALRGRWTLHRGSSARALPGLLRELGAADLFLHDSLHTRRNMRREFEEVWPYLRTGGVILADDVERNRAFGGLRRKGPALWRVVRDRERNPLHGRAAPVVFGMVVK
jgi:predicted O-methyltransferase YrrM